MDHSYIDEHNVADRYILGTLSAEERARFEEHFVDCPQCLDRLEDAESWRRAFKAAAAEGRRVMAWPSKTVALLLAACLVMAVAPLLLWRELSRVRADLDRTRRVSSEWQRRYQESSQARVEPPPLPSTVPVFPLVLTRGATAEPSAPPVYIVLPQGAPWAVLSLELAHYPSLLSYRARLFTVRGQQVWTASGLKPSQPTSLALVIPSQLLEPGDYVLTLEGLTSRGSFIPVGRYPLRVEK
jgi:hypothetical protein